MSNLVLPVFPGLTWNTTRKPLFSTVVKSSVSGREFRTAQYAYPIWQYRQSYEVLRSRTALPEMQQLLSFFNLHGGSFDSWRYLDPLDNAVSAYRFGTGDGVTKVFQLLRTIGSFTEPVYELKGYPLVYINGINVSNAVAPYGGMDSDSNADGLANGWTAYYAGTVGTVTYSRPAGVQRVAASGMGNASADQIGIRMAGQIPTTGGQPWTARVDVKHGGLNPRVYVDWYGPGGGAGYGAGSGYLSTSQQLFSTVGGTATTIIFNATAPAGAEGGYWYLWGEAHGTSPASNFIEFDYVGITPTPVDPSWSDVDFAVNMNTGVVTFGTAPSNGDALTWTGGYYQRCRFLQDQLDLNQFMRDFWDLRTLEFKTVKP